MHALAFAARRARAVRLGIGVAALLAALACAGCADGLFGAPSVTDSPAVAADAAAAKAQSELRRESLGAHCYADAVVAGVVARRSLRDTAAHPEVDTRPLGVEAARRRLLADASLVPVYCRNAEPAGVAATRDALAKLRDAAAWFATRGLALAGPPVAATVAVRATTTYKELEIYDTGRTQTAYFDRMGAQTIDASVTAHGGTSRQVPVQDAIVHREGEVGTARAAGEYREAWILVQVSRAGAAAYRAACARLRGDAARAAPAAPYEALAACALYAGDTLPPGLEHPAVVPLNPEE